MTDREELEIAVKALDSRKAKNITALKVEDRVHRCSLQCFVCNLYG